MAQFNPNEPVITREPVVEVDAGLNPGRYIFQLVVINQRDVRSLPATVTVTVTRRLFPPPLPPGRTIE